jgi:hypothetical protein
MKKNIFKLLLVFSAILVSFTACKNDIDYVVAEKAKPTTLLSPTEATSFVLNKSLSGENLTTFVWAPADYNYQGEYNYTIEICKAGTNFEQEVITLGPTTDTFYSVTNGVLNTQLLGVLGLIPGAPTDVQVRIKSYLGVNGEPNYSASITISVTPYVDYRALYLFGSATATESLGTDSFPLFKDPTNDSKFSTTGYFKAGTFEVAGGTTSDAAVYGDVGVGGQLGSEGATAIAVPADGYYQLEINFENATYTLTPVSAPTNTYALIGLSGAFNGWAAPDAKLIAQSFDIHIWRLAKQELPAGGDGFKFRVNEDWTINWGGDTFPSGIGLDGGSNIKADVEGDYEIWFNDITKQYLFLKL